MYMLVDYCLAASVAPDSDDGAVAPAVPLVLVDDAPGTYGAAAGVYAGDAGEYAAVAGWYAGEAGEYAGDAGEYADEAGE